MAELKTKANDASVSEFLDAIEHDGKREDARAILQIMQDVAGCEPQMWGASIIGFGRYQYKSDSGRGGEWFRIGFSPRKRNLTIYVINGFSNYATLIESLGKHKISKSCLYINKLKDVDVDVLRTLMVESLNDMRETYPEGA